MWSTRAQLYAPTPTGKVLAGAVASRLRRFSPRSYRGRGDLAVVALRSWDRWGAAPSSSSRPSLTQEPSMKTAAVLALMLTFVACAVPEDDSGAPPEEAPAELTAPAEAAPLLVPAELAPPAAQSCAPGPSGNWCHNREGYSCPVEGVRSRCFIPSYCEWAVLRCEGGIWVMIG
jgi:hypothetical protein